MKTIFLKFTSLICLLLLVVCATTVSSCKKDQTCRGYVNVYDTIAQKIPGVTVRLDAYSINGVVTYTELTDGNGMATFDIALPAIFDVYAFKDDMPGTISRREGKGSLNVDEPRKEGWSVVTIKQ